MLATPLIIPFGDHEAIVGAHWEDFPKGESGLLKRGSFLKKQLQQAKAELYSVSEQRAYSFSAGKGDKRQAPHKFCILNKRKMDIKAGTTVGSQSFCAQLESLGKELPVASIYVLLYKLSPAQTNSPGDDTYWACAVSDRGVVQFDAVFESEFMALSQAFSFITYRTHIITINCEQDTLSKITAETARHDGEFALTYAIMTPEEWVSNLKSSHEKKWTHPRTISSSFQHGKSVGVWAATAIIIGAAYSVSGYLSQREAISFFSDVQNADLSPGVKLITPPKKSKSGQSQWDLNTFEMEVKSQYADFESRHPSSPAAVIDTVYELSASMPAYLYEFRLSKISYSDGQIFVHFIREPKSNTVFYFLDDAIKEMNKYLKVKLSPFDIQDRGNVRIYTAKALHDRPVDTGIKQQVQSYHKLNNELAAISSRLNKGYSALKSTKAKYESLTMSQIIIDREPEKLLTEFKEQQRDLESLEKEFNVKHAKLKSIKTPEINEDKLVGQVMDFVTLMQLDDKFTWNHPVLSRTFPDKKSIENNASIDKKATSKDKKQKTAARKKKKQIQFSPVLESYLVEIVTNEEKDVEANTKITSFGNLDLVQLKDLINKPFIHILDVQYDMMSSQWAVKVLFTRKRPEFNTLMLPGSAQ